MGDMWEEVIATFGEEKEVSSNNEGAPARAVDDPVIVIILDEDIKKTSVCGNHVCSKVEQVSSEDEKQRRRIYLQQQTGW